MNRTDNIATDSKKSKLSELTSRINIANGKIVQNIDRIDDINNTLLGLMPECEKNSDVQPCRAGSIGLLEDKIVGLEERVVGITLRVNRLKDSDII